jgi:hypothetical protein
VSDVSRAAAAIGKHVANALKSMRSLDAFRARRRKGRKGELWKHSSAAHT